MGLLRYLEIMRMVQYNVFVNDLSAIKASESVSLILVLHVSEIYPEYSNHEMKLNCFSRPYYLYLLWFIFQSACGNPYLKL